MPEVASQEKYLGLPTMVWRLLIEPESPLARVYKARYYPSGDYWSSTLGPKPSFTWRSLLSVKWLLEDGTFIKIWKHSWVEHTWSKIPITPVPPDFIEAKVSDLIDADIETWNISKVRSWLFNVDNDEILKIKVNRLEPDILGPTTSGLDHNFNIAGKIKHFFWRALQNNLPITDNLRKRKVEVQPTCILCGSGDESVMHVFNSCPFTQDVNKTLQIPMETVNLHEFHEIYQEKRKRLLPDRFKAWMVRIWLIWHQRNLRMNGTAHRPAAEIAGATISYLATQEAAPGVLQHMNSPSF
ncbi:hypothetical protein LIER_16689 [Lithospermum erythrorhizon]|uniref:Reverse transcriptase zinc-binding domain-containing protein n=1 Tax=Lithospermum erythrorhizon TaxID=34254 RepID=A0AAV3Q7Y2_LITER